MEEEPVAVAPAAAALLVLLELEEVLVEVIVTVVCPPLPLSACSLAPLSVPQFPWYQVMTCWFWLGSVQKASQMPFGVE